MNQDFRTIVAFGRGWRTYVVAATLIAATVLERVLHVDVPGISVDQDWLAALLAATGLATLRAAVGRTAG